MVKSVIIPPKLKIAAIAFLLTVGIFGTIHILSSVTIAIYRQRLGELNPFYIIHVDQSLGKIADSGFAQVVAWVVWIGVIFALYRALASGSK